MKREIGKIIEGVLQVNSRGFGFVTPEGHDRKDDIYISKKKLGGAMNGDRVQITLFPDNFGQHTEGRVTKILQHKITHVVGLFIKTGDFAFVEPDDKRLPDLLIPKRCFHGAKHLDKVYAQITVYANEEEHCKAEGKIVEVLGRQGDVGLEILSIIKQKDLPLEFPKEVLAAVKKLPEQIKEGELKERLDRRQRMIVTIDGEDAKDFDDAIWVEKVPDKQEWQLGVYIADVSYYVKEQGVIDQEALERGTSVYLTDRVLPMLPERLCNDLCSLKEDVDRLVLACEMRINARGKVVDYLIAPGVIRSRHRLTYNIVRSILAGDEEQRQKYADCVPMLEAADELRKVLGRMRRKRGSINFDVPELKVILDEKLHPVEIVKRVQGDAENLIEEFMLAANECVARHLTVGKYPAVYRVHAEPKESSMNNLMQLLALLHVEFHHDEKIEPKDVQRVLEAVQGRPEERLVSAAALRSMCQAVYQTENIGHFGLAAPCYVHFTSPIRRYPDLLIHRLLRLLWAKPKLKKAEYVALQEHLEELAQQCSRRERLAVEAERAVRDLKLCEYMADHVGEEFDGIISGVTNFGVFVELPNGVEGMIRLESLKDDFYEFKEKLFMVVGVRKRRHFQLGDPLRIQVAAVNTEAVTIDFILAKGTLGDIKTHAGFLKEENHGKKRRQRRKKH